MHTPRGHRDRRRFLVALVLAIAATTGVQIAPGAATPVQAAPRGIDDPTPRPLGAVTVIGDSVLLGSLLVDPTVVVRLGELGWGPIRARAGEGYSTGYFATNPSWKASGWIESWRAGGWDAPNVLVNLGANDSGGCGSDTACAERAIMHLVDAIGPGHQIWWPKITRFPYYQHQADAWNAALDRVAAARADVHTWDWPAVMASGGFASPDNTHLNGTGYRQRSILLAEQFTRDLARARSGGSVAALPATIGGATEYVALTPDRVLDTRRTRSTPLPAGGSVSIDLTDDVPAGTTAVAVNLTSAATTAPGFLTAHPCDRAPGDVSSVNHDAGVPRGAAAIIPLSADGELCVVTAAPGHVIVDLQGAFVPDGGLRLTPVEPTRLDDTRRSGRSNPLVVEVPGAPDAVAVNLTAVRGGSGGYLTADACTADGTPRTTVSNVNFLAGEAVAGAAIVPVADDGTICVWSSVPVDVVVDLTGAFSDTGTLRFQPVVPTRAIDVRDGTGGWLPVIGTAQSIDTVAAPTAAAMISGTVTLIRPIGGGYATVDCTDDPDTSNVNASPGAVMANAATVPLDSGGRLCLWSSSASKILFDTTGWWIE